MISNLLDIARLEDGSLQMIMEKLEPEDLINEAISRVFAQLKFKKIIIKTQVTEPSTFMGDRSLLLRVFQNLLLNAIHYSPEGKQITVGYYNEEGQHYFFIEDQGPGIHQAYLNSIFDKYTQLQKSQGSKDHTVGLGLSFCRLAVQAHNGVIEAKSDGVNGTTFTFTLL